MSRKAMSIAVVGIDYPNKRGPARRFELQICRPGERVELRAEPQNKYDEHAVAVFSSRGIQLGYLPSERAVLIGTLWRRGTEIRAIFQQLDRAVAWVRLAFDGEDPVLPATLVPVEGGDSDFEPDPIYDE